MSSQSFWAMTGSWGHDPHQQISPQTSSRFSAMLGGEAQGEEMSMAWKSVTLSLSLAFSFPRAVLRMCFSSTRPLLSSYPALESVNYGLKPLRTVTPNKPSLL